MRTARLVGGPAPRYCRRMTVADIPAGFDTLAATRDLEAAGIERRAGLATKVDLDNLEARMDRRFAEFEARVNGRFAEFEARMLKAAISIVLAQTALTFGLLKLLGGAP